MKRILIVEDNAQSRYYLRQLLTGHDYAVQEAGHGAEALVLARKEPPDLILSDLLMPVMDGFRLLMHWKSDPVLARIPFVVYTATYTESADRDLVVALGADNFILKPAEPEAFLIAIREVLDKGCDEKTKPLHLPMALKENRLATDYTEAIFRKLDQKGLELSEALRKLAEREALMRLQTGALAAAANAIVITDAQGKIEWANPAFTRFTGYSLEEIRGKKPSLLKSGTQAESFYANLWQAILGGEVWQGEVTNRRKDGTLYIEDMTITPIKDAGGRISHFVAVKQDITERKRLEQQFLRSQRLDSIGTLAGGIAHDLNNVLTPIVMAVDYLKLRVTDATSLEVISTIGTSARRGAELVSQVLMFAKGADSRRYPVALAPLVREISCLAAETFPKNIHRTITVGEDLPDVLGDPTQLHQILLNLCLNARDAMPEGGRMILRARRLVLDTIGVTLPPEALPGIYVLLEVEDSGMGIDAENLGKIFDPFYTTKAPDKGTGLGLSTTHAIVKSHGGFIQVESTKGVGTSFRVYLPALDGLPAGASAERRAPVRRGNGETLLVVDDEASIRQITSQTLQANGYKVLIAADGAEAIAIYAPKAAAVDLVLLDMRMPVMDGLSALKAMYRINPQVQIIVTTGNPADGQMARAAEAGIRFFLEKPYSAEQLLGIVQRALAAHATVKDQP